MENRHKQSNCVAAFTQPFL